MMNVSVRRLINDSQHFYIEMALFPALIRLFFEYHGLSRHPGNKLSFEYHELSTYPKNIPKKSILLQNHSSSKYHIDLFRRLRTFYSLVLVLVLELDLLIALTEL